MNYVLVWRYNKSDLRTRLSTYKSEGNNVWKIANTRTVLIADLSKGRTEWYNFQGNWRTYSTKVAKG